MQQHVRVHLLQFVTVHTRFRDGKPQTIQGDSVDFYVCPNTGTLCEFQHAPGSWVEGGHKAWLSLQGLPSS